ncbi:hypothetical protein [Pseudoalteromonas sp. MTN2-4]|uniref:hypothetical protein n=1 Tax=Pseudoalteromonas sp. MTN2-4 TaxID=3056555 RepID=UPI0036F3F24E
MKYLYLIVCLLPCTVQASADPQEKEYLLKFVQKARDYFNTGQGCKPKYSFEDRMYLVEEFLSIKDVDVKNILYRNENEIGIFLERTKPERPGLSLEVYLKDGKCKEFYIYQIMH